jgi:hypothetical protein
VGKKQRENLISLQTAVTCPPESNLHRKLGPLALERLKLEIQGWNPKGETDKERGRAPDPVTLGSRGMFPVPSRAQPN